jgi:hypothetical protein
MEKWGKQFPQRAIAWGLLFPLPLQWLWRAIGEIGDLDFLITHMQDPGWIGRVARMLYNIVSGPEIACFTIGVAWLTYMHWHPEQEVEEGNTLQALPLPSRNTVGDTANIEKIAVLFRAHGNAAYEDIKKMQGRFGKQFRTRNDQDKFTGDILYSLADDGIFSRCRSTWLRMSQAVVSPGRYSLREIEVCFAEFYLAYLKYVEWIGRLTELFPPIMQTYPEYVSWQEKDQSFQRMVREIIALSEFSSLRFDIDEPGWDRIL